MFLYYKEISIVSNVQEVQKTKLSYISFAFMVKIVTNITINWEFQVMYTLQLGTGASRSLIQGVTADVHGYLLIHWATIRVKVGYLCNTPPGGVTE